jgi:hypothetical protein
VSTTTQILLVPVFLCIHVLTRWCLLFLATLFRKYPDLRLGVKFEDIKYTDPRMDIGILELPVLC